MPSGPRTDRKTEVGRRLAVARRRTGLTQKQLAHVLGVAPPTVQAWEQGRADPYRRTRDLERVLGIDAEWLFGNADIVSRPPSRRASAPRRATTVPETTDPMPEIDLAYAVADLTRRVALLEQQLRALEERRVPPSVDD
jgi:transcriptional regulator with XRE-family HTH domain